MTSTIYFRVQAAARRNILWSPIVLMLAEIHIWAQSERGTTPRQGAYESSEGEGGDEIIALLS